MVQIESILVPMESILSIIESILVTIESVYHNPVNSEHNRVGFFNRVDFCHNRLDSGAAHNTIFGSTILKQTACHNIALYNSIHYIFGLITLLCR